MSLFALILKRKKYEIFRIRNKNTRILYQICERNRNDGANHSIIEIELRKHIVCGMEKNNKKPKISKINTNFASSVLDTPYFFYGCDRCTKIIITMKETKQQKTKPLGTDTLNWSTRSAHTKDPRWRNKYDYLKRTFSDERTTATKLNSWVYRVHAQSAIFSPRSSLFLLLLLLFDSIAFCEIFTRHSRIRFTSIFSAWMCFVSTNL